MCSKEVYCVGSVDVDLFIHSHWAIYVVIDNNEVVGFASYLINDSYGMNAPAVLNDYLYVIPDYIGTMATQLMLMQTGRIVEELNLPLEHCYASYGSKKLSRKLEGKNLYTAYRYEVNEVLREYSRLKEIARRKRKWLKITYTIVHYC